MQNMLNDGILLLDKDIGKTSFQAINEIKKTLNIKKIGHAGTLDKNAAGLMIVGIGKSTKLLKFFVKLPKRYIADIKFGIQTTTDDPEGIEIKKYNGEIDPDKIKKELSKFYGKIKQIPPDFSAIHIEGQRAYKIAMKNIKPEIKEREVEITRLNVLSFEKPILKLDIECTSGTYIRSIARDLGTKTGYFAHLSSLQRATIDNFSVENAFNIEEIKNNKFKIISPYNALVNMKAFEVKDEYIDNIKNGKKILFDYFIALENGCDLKNGYYKVHKDNNLLAILIYNNGIFKYDLVY